MIRLRNFLRRIGRYFPPNWWLAALVAIDGYLFVRPVLGRAVDYPMDYWLSFDSWRDAMDAVGLADFPAQYGRRPLPYLPGPASPD